MPLDTTASEAPSQPDTVSGFIAEWNSRNPSPAIGDSLTFPDIGQTHSIVGAVVWHVEGSTRHAGHVWRSRCAVCNTSYDHATGLAPGAGMARTCPEHRGAWRSPWTIRREVKARSAKRKASRKVERETRSAITTGPRRDVGRRGKHQRHLLALIDGLRLIGRHAIPWADLLPMALEGTAPVGGRFDFRPRRLEEALEALAKEKPTAPIRIARGIVSWDG